MTNGEKPGTRGEQSQSRVRPSRDNDIDDSVWLRYYESLVEIWTHQDSTYWTSVNVFLVLQGIIFVALFTAYDSEPRYLVSMAIGGIGFAISIMWLFVGARWREALLLLDHQGRRLEEMIFSSVLDDSELNKNKDAYFPMYFWANRAVFYGNESESRQLSDESLKDERTRRTDKDKRITDCIRAYHLDVCGYKSSSKSMGRFSSNKIMSLYLPVMFATVWISVAALSLWFHKWTPLW